MERKTFDKDEFVGKDIKDVEQFYDVKFRVMMEDGEVFCGTCDVRPERYNFAVNNGIITSVWMG
jgi:hypothetical protein